MRPSAARGAEIADVLEAVGGVLAATGADDWERASLCSGWRVKDTVAHLVWRLGTPSMRFVRDIATSSVREKALHPARAMDRIARASAAEHSCGELLELVGELGVRKRAGIGRTGLGELTEAVVHGYDIAYPIGKLTLPHDVTRRVARAGVLTASRSVRVTLRHRTLVAVDADWSLGDGPELQATAQSIVLFVFGRRAIDDGYVRVLAPGRSPAPTLA